MNAPSSILAVVRDAADRRAKAERNYERMWTAFGKSFKNERTRRRISLRTMGKRLKITGQMLNYLETGQRRWTFERAELAVKLLTRKEEWPD
jgi:hypothetical protein